MKLKKLSVDENWKPKWQQCKQWSKNCSHAQLLSKLAFTAFTLTQKLPNCKPGFFCIKNVLTFCTYFLTPHCFCCCPTLMVQLYNNAHSVIKYILIFIDFFFYQWWHICFLLSWLFACRWNYQWAFLLLIMTYLSPAHKIIILWPSSSTVFLSLLLICFQDGPESKAVFSALCFLNVSQVITGHWTLTGQWFWLMTIHSGHIHGEH